MNQKALTKGQHWIPQFYLKHFAGDKGELFAYRRKDEKLYQTNVRDACTKNYLYEVERSAETKSGNRFIAANKIEERLSRTESLLAPCYAGFIRSCEDGRMSGDDFQNGRLAICYLFSSILERHPYAVADRRSTAASVAQQYLESGCMTESEAVRLTQNGFEGELVAASEQFAMEAALFPGDREVALKRIYRSLCMKKLIVMEAPIGAEFITSSLPLYVVNSKVDAFDIQAAYMPISGRYAVLFARKLGPTEWRMLSYSEVTRRNSSLLAGHDVWESAYSKAKAPLERTVQDLRFW